MNIFSDGWFTELCSLWPGVSLSLKIKQILHQERSEFQDILVVETESHGRALILDGIIQCTEADEFSYQEMMAFLPTCCHPNPKKVLIVGGGDGGVARELIKHPLIDHIDQVEIDARVLEVAKQFLPFMSKSFSHPKVTVRVCNGFNFIEKCREDYDVIITDSSDPVGPAISLFQTQYYDKMKRALKPGGVVCCQVGTIWTDMEEVIEMMKRFRLTFSNVALAFASVPTYPSGQISFLLGTSDKGINFKEPAFQFSEAQLDSFQLRYYSPNIHRSAFVLPRFAEKAVKEAGFD